MSTTTITPVPVPPEVLAAPVPFDLYREVHKGLRLALFDLVVAAGRAECTTAEGRRDIVAHTRRVVELLHAHHGHEDVFIQPVIEAHAPRLAAIIEAGHIETDQDLVEVDVLLDRLEGAEGGDAVAAGLDLYRRLALFTAGYLTHMALEEGGVMEALRAGVDLDLLFGVEIAIRTTIAPDRMIEFMGVMLPAMNPDERTAMLGGMQAGMPPEVFATFRAAAESILDADDFAVVAERIGVA